MTPAAEALPARRTGLLARLASWWALLGFVAVMLEAILRLAPKALVGLDDPSPFTLGIYAVSVTFMLITEGYRGFQQRFAPRFAQRALFIRAEPTALRVLFAPFYAMALFDAPRRRVIGSWVLVAVIVALVLLVARLPQPWRGAVDAGVVAGLSYGLVVTVGFFLQGLRAELAPPEA
ncbi:MAG: hypothetical protein H6741_31135 [Alphaproteobacteria bacterium]|nr:hypothetical protein [Alphaproteobacteria bacterium]